MRSVTTLALVAMLAACSGNNETTTDMGPTETADAAVTSDSGPPGEDTGSAGATDSGSVDTGRVTDDMATPGDAGATADTGADASTGPDGGGDPYAGRPTGQCNENADCPDGPNGRNCSTALPGGACLGCGSDNDCPGDAVCSQFGACVTECDNNDDCPPGLSCSSTGCSAIDCVNDECPVPLFGCNDSDRCERIDCSNDPDICPTDTTCIGGRCVEDRSLNP